MINNIINLIVKYGAYGGAITAAITMDGNRITVINDRKFGQIDMIQKEREALENQKLLEEKVQEELRNLDLSGIFSSLYNNYIEFISNLSPDKLVCVFNIIIDGLVFSSFLTVLGIMLSEQVINKITWPLAFARKLLFLFEKSQR